MLRESSALATNETRETAQIQVDNLTNRLLDVLNSSVEGSYIFSGNRTDTVPFVRNGDTVIYQGNDEIMTAAGGPRRRPRSLNIPGTEFMGAISATLTGGPDLAPRLDPTTSLDDLNLGAAGSRAASRSADGANNLDREPRRRHHRRRRDDRHQHRHRRRRDRHASPPMARDSSSPAPDR